MADYQISFLTLCLLSVDIKCFALLDHWIRSCTRIAPSASPDEICPSRKQCPPTPRFSPLQPPRFVNSELIFLFPSSTCCLLHPQNHSFPSMAAATVIEMHNVLCSSHDSSSGSPALKTGGCSLAKPVPRTGNAAGETGASAAPSAR